MLPLLALVTAALANDSTAGFDAGGLVLVHNDHVRLLSEDLYLSEAEVRVRYEFRNEGDKDEHLLIAFPMPDLQVGESDVSIPSQDPENFLGFSTIFDGHLLPSEVHRYAWAAGVDRTALLGSLGIPLAPHLQATRDALAKLSPARQAELVHLGLVNPMVYDAGQGWQTDYLPAWTLKSTWTWEATFPAGKTVVVQHRYTPSVGGSVGTGVLAAEQRADYAERYCVDEGFLKAVRAASGGATDYGAPFTEWNFGYILTTGGNWAGPIGRFHLTVDKGAPRNLVSFCGTGVRKTGPTTFELTAENFWPARDLAVLILKPYGE